MNRRQSECPPSVLHEVAVTSAAGSSSDRGRPLWAQSGLAAMQRAEFEPRSGSSHSRTADISMFSNRWSGVQTFDDSKRPLNDEGRNGGTEPDADVDQADRRCHAANGCYETQKSRSRLDAGHTTLIEAMLHLMAR